MRKSITYQYFNTKSDYSVGCKYKTKPIKVQAIRYLGSDNIFTVIKFLDNRPYSIVDKGKVLINTPDGFMKFSIGEYIIKGQNGELYSCGPDIFEKTYEQI